MHPELWIHDLRTIRFGPVHLRNHKDGDFYTRTLELVDEKGQGITLRLFAHQAEELEPSTQEETHVG
jgi:hypothetical protein